MSLHGQTWVASAAVAADATDEVGGDDLAADSTPDFVMYCELVFTDHDRRLTDGAVVVRLNLSSRTA